MKINLTDNNIASKENVFYKREDISDLFPYANKTIEQLCKEHEKLLILPECLENSKDNINEEVVFSLDNTDQSEIVQLTTSNIVGFFGVKGIKVKIQSRFDKGRDDYFLHYMLEKVLSLNLFDLNHNQDEENIFDFLLYMFPHFLKAALRQGLYREYQGQEHNDAKVRGTINVSEFIRKCIPFSGNVAYSVRNYSYDNAMTELIRHTIEYMKTRSNGRDILTMDTDTANNVRSITEITPNYKRNNRSDIIQQNLRPKVHPYYTAYQPLRTLCLQILRVEEMKYGDDEDEIHGILFDAAWLWEEYLFIAIFKNCGFSHPRNREKKDGIYLFHHPSGSIRYPDYLKPDFILDAKYKRLDKKGIDRDDMHQIISYMHVEKARQGGFVYPFESDQEISTCSCLGELRGDGGRIYRIGVSIPQHCNSFKEFSLKMKQIEDSLQKRIQETEMKFPYE